MIFSIKSIFRKINSENINKTMDSFNKGMKSFDKVIQDFGDSMDQLTNELNQTSKDKPKIWSDSWSMSDEEVIDKIWGKKND